jgi:hypothetical protein
VQNLQTLFKKINNGDHALVDLLSEFHSHSTILAPRTIEKMKILGAVFELPAKQSSNFISNMNDNFYEASFEVYYISVSQKLAILGFSYTVFAFC